MLCNFFILSLLSIWTKYKSKHHLEETRDVFRTQSTSMMEFFAKVVNGQGR